MQAESDGAFDPDLLARALADIVRPFGDLYREHRGAAIDVARLYYRLLRAEDQTRVRRRYAELLLGLRQDEDLPGG